MDHRKLYEALHKLSDSYKAIGEAFCNEPDVPENAYYQGRIDAFYEAGHQINLLLSRIAAGEDC